MATTIFQRCGGFATVRLIVSAFYDRILDSATLQRFFIDVDMRNLIDHQTKFISAVMGGPATYNDDVLERVHARLNIARSEFEEMAALLRETLEDHDLDQADVNHIINELVKRAPIIVAKE